MNYLKFLAVAIHFQLMKDIVFFLMISTLKNNF